MALRFFSKDDSGVEKAEREQKARRYLGAITKRSAPSIKEALVGAAPDIARIAKEIKGSRDETENFPDIPQPIDSGAEFLAESTALLNSIKVSKPSKGGSVLTKKIQVYSDGSEVKETSSAESVVRLPQLDSTFRALTVIQQVNTKGFRSVINSVYDLSAITRTIYAQEHYQYSALNESLKQIAKLSNIKGATAVQQAGSVDNLLTTGFSISKFTKMMQMNAEKKAETDWLAGSALGSESNFNDQLLEMMQGLQDDPAKAIGKFGSNLVVDKLLGDKKEALNNKARELSLTAFDALSNSEVIQNNEYVDKVLDFGDRISNNKYLGKLPLVSLLSKENTKEALGKFLKDTRKNMFGEYDPDSPMDLSNKVDKSTAVAFDMGTHVSINEVIPGYLAKILSAINGAPEIYNDYSTGKWMTKEDLDARISKKQGKSIQSGLKTSRLQDLVKQVWGEEAGDKSDLLSTLVKKGALSKDQIASLKDGSNDEDIDKLTSFLDSGLFQNVSYRNAIIALRSKFKTISEGVASGSAKNAFSQSEDLSSTAGVRNSLEGGSQPVLGEIDATVTEIRDILRGWWGPTTFSSPTPTPTGGSSSASLTAVNEGLSKLTGLLPEPIQGTAQSLLSNPVAQTAIGKTAGALDGLQDPTSPVQKLLPAPVQTAVQATSILKPLVQASPLGDILPEKQSTVALPAPTTSSAPSQPVSSGNNLLKMLPAAGTALASIASLGTAVGPIMGAIKGGSLISGLTSVGSSLAGKALGSTALPTLSALKESGDFVGGLGDLGGVASSVLSGVAPQGQEPAPSGEVANAPSPSGEAASVAKAGSEDQVLNQIKANAQAYEEENQAQKEAIEKESEQSTDLANDILSKGMKGITGLAALSGAATAGKMATGGAAAAAATGAAASTAAGGIATALGATGALFGGLLATGTGLIASLLMGKKPNTGNSAADAQIEKGLVESGMARQDVLNKVKTDGPALDRQTLMMSPVGNAYLTEKYGMDPVNPSDSIMKKIERWFKSLEAKVKSSSSGSSVAGGTGTATGGTAGGTSGIPGDKKEFLRIAMNNDFGVDKAKMFEDVKKRSARVKVWLGNNDANIERVYQIVKQAGMSPEFFFAYEIQEGGTYWGWLNHTSYKGDPYVDAAAVAAWAVAESKNMSPMNLAWGDYANSPAEPDEATKAAGNADANSLPAGSIGRMYLRGTAAAVWATYAPNWLKKSVNGVSDYGDPIAGCMEVLRSWGASTGGSSSSGSQASGNTGSGGAIAGALGKAASSTGKSVSSSSASGSSTNTNSDKFLNIAKSFLGQYIGNSQCYAFTSAYASAVDPVHISGGLTTATAIKGGIAAADIGEDYPWAQWGWTVVHNPKYEDVRPGDIVNYYRGAGGLYDPNYGHTGVVGVVAGGNYELYDQNPSPVKVANIPFQGSHISSLIHPPGSVPGAGGTSGVAAAGGTLANLLGTSAEIKWKLSEAEQQKIKDRVVNKYTKAYEDSVAGPKTGIDPKTGQPGTPITGGIDPKTGKPYPPNSGGSTPPGGATTPPNGSGALPKPGPGGVLPPNNGKNPIVGIDGNGNVVVINPTQNNTSTVVNNYYKKVDDKVDEDKLKLLKQLLNSVNLIGGYTRSNLDTILKILKELEDSNSLLDTNNELSETTNELLKRLRLGGAPQGWTGDVNDVGSLDFLLDTSLLDPIIQGVR